MEEHDDFTGPEILTALTLEALSVVGGIAIGRKLSPAKLDKILSL